VLSNIPQFSNAFGGMSHFEFGGIKSLMSDSSAQLATSCTASTEIKAPVRPEVGVSAFMFIWTGARTVGSNSHRSPGLEVMTVLCRPFYMPRELTAVCR